MRLAGVGVTISSGVRAGADPGVGVGGGHLAETGPEATDAGAVLRQRPAVGGAQGVLEQGVGVNRQDDAALHLELGRAGLLHAEE